LWQNTGVMTLRFSVLNYGVAPGITLPLKTIHPELMNISERNYS